MTTEDNKLAASPAARRARHVSEPGSLTTERVTTARPIFSKTAFKKQFGFRWKPSMWVDAGENMTLAPHYVPRVISKRMLRNLLRPHPRQRRLSKNTQRGRGVR